MATENYYTLEGQVRVYEADGDTYRVVTGDELEAALDDLLGRNPDLDAGATLSSGHAHITWLAAAFGSRRGSTP